MKIKKIVWGQESPPDNECGYNHVKGETAMGSLLITWKGWKDWPSYDVEDVGTGEHLLSSGSLERAKNDAQDRHDSRILQCIEDTQSTAQKGG